MVFFPLFRCIYFIFLYLSKGRKTVGWRRRRPFNCWSANPPVDTRQPLAVAGRPFIYTFILYMYICVCLYGYVVKTSVSDIYPKSTGKTTLVPGVMLNGRLKYENNRLRILIRKSLTTNVHGKSVRGILDALGQNSHGWPIYTLRDRHPLLDTVVGFIWHHQQPDLHTSKITRDPDTWMYEYQKKKKKQCHRE